MCWQDPRKLSNCADMFNPLNAATRVARAPSPAKARTTKANLGQPPPAVQRSEAPQKMR